MDVSEQQCASCKRLFPISEFNANAKMPSGLHSWCRECSASSSRQWREAHPEAVAEYNASRRRGPVDLTCDECGETFMASRVDRLTCSISCRDKRLRRLRAADRRAEIAKSPGGAAVIAPASVSTGSNRVRSGLPAPSQPQEAVTDHPPRPRAAE